MRDALNNYLALATGLTEVTRQRAEAAAKALVAQGEAAAEQVRPLAEELLAASRANRENVAVLVRTEVDKALGRVGIVTADEMARLQRRLQTVESTLRGVGATTSAFATTARKAADRRGGAKPGTSGGKPSGNTGASAPRAASAKAKATAKAPSKAATSATTARAVKPATPAKAAKATPPAKGATPAKATKATKPATKATKPAKAAKPAPGSGR